MNRVNTVNNNLIRLPFYVISFKPIVTTMNHYLTTKNDFVKIKILSLIYV